MGRHNEEDLQRSYDVSKRLHGVSRELSRLAARVQKQGKTIRRIHEFPSGSGGCRTKGAARLRLADHAPNKREGDLKIYHPCIYS